MGAAPVSAPWARVHVPIIGSLVAVRLRIIPGERVVNEDA
jgi:hypothetical protein